MDLLRNLRAGIRLASFRKVGVGDFRFSIDQVVLLALLAPLLGFAGSYLTSEEPRDFYLPAIESSAFRLSLTLLFAFLATRLRTDAALLRLSVLLLSTVAFEWLLVTGLDLAERHLTGFADEPTAVTLGLRGWFATVCYRALRLAGPLGRLRSALTTATYLTALWVVFDFVPGERFWETDTWSAAQPSERIDAERVLFAQRDRIDDALAALLPERANVPDLYFVGFAGDATQDVFMREVEFVQALFDREFGTRGRSIGLVNHPETLDRLPVASESNLEAVLAGVGHWMNPQEDVLFLFLTAHGSRDSELTVEFSPLPLNPIDPDGLARMLERAGIRWRVIVVSSCFSGGFVEALRNDDSLVITASAADRESFGCSSEADFTYFGRAYFKEALARGMSFTDAFDAAAEQVARWEERDDVEASQPQMALGSAIGAKLAELEARWNAGR